nr:alpha/beta hydrolase fold protein [uncultured bacterium]
MRRVTFLISGFALAATLAGSAQQNRPTQPPPGRLVNIGGHSLHIRCVGPATGGPTVVLEAGAGNFSNRWTAVQDLLAPRVRSCAYDRAGWGWSEPGRTPRTLQQTVFELHALLEKAKVPGPFVLVGHSLGGLVARLYADRYSAAVMGVVLVDALHEDSVQFNLRINQWARIRELSKGRVVPEARLATATTPDTSEDDYLAEELQQIYLSRRSNPTPLGDRPLIVLHAGKRPPPPGTSEEFWTNLKQEKDDQGMDLARLSRNSKFVRDPLSGHNIHVDNPVLVATAIEEVVTAGMKGTKLAETR